MKIVHISEAWKGGVATYVESLATRQVKDGHVVTLLIDEKNYKSDFRNLIDIQVGFYNASRNPFKFISIHMKLLQLLSEIKPDIVHVHSTYPGVYVRLMKTSFNIIYTPHAWSFFKGDIGFIKRIIYKKIEKYLSRNTNRILCISFAEIDAAKNIGIKASKLAVVHTGIPDICESYVEDDSNAGSSNIKVGFFGRLDFQKGYDLLNQVNITSLNNIEIHVFGEAVRTEQYVKNNQFKYHGWIEHSSMSRWLSTVDIILMPSRWEGFALTPLEAMCCSKASIVSNESSLPEIIISGFNGFVLKYLDSKSIELQLNSLTKDECKRLGLNARLVYENSFSFEVYYTKLMSVYFDVL
jgi:glycosyltransferase involved in cell wall biosynthesis